MSMNSLNAHPEMGHLRDICVVRRLSSSEDQPYASSKTRAEIERSPDLNPICLLLSGHREKRY
jgi:hypothetical protein